MHCNKFNLYNQYRFSFNLLLKTIKSFQYDRELNFVQFTTHYQLAILIKVSNNIPLPSCVSSAKYQKLRKLREIRPAILQSTVNLIS